MFNKKWCILQIAHLFFSSSAVRVNEERCAGKKKNNNRSTGRKVQVREVRYVLNLLRVPGGKAFTSLQSICS